MVSKIISGGQTGADQAALDAAIKFNIEHGGWVPEGRKRENGVLPLKYRMQEMDTTNYAARTRKNVMDSDGTVLLARGPLRGGTLLTQKIALQADRPCCHIDLLAMDEFEGSLLLNSFVTESDIRVLNVAGPRLSNDPGIYRSVKAVIEALIYMQVLEEGIEFEAVQPSETPEQAGYMPETIEQSVRFLEKNLSFKTKSGIANLDDGHIASLYFSLGDTVKELFQLHGNRSPLVDRYFQRNSRQTHDIDDLVMDIIKRLKRTLEDDYQIRVVE
ncbi:MAG: putative molybdenum carrier protein [Desulfarculaceae bacterium]|nr:putative molybdenum carrier protein [Desulfarculaceae bacterium]